MLGQSLRALREDFDTHADRWRVVLLVSPTCGECVLGAEAVEREIMARYPAARVRAEVVWIPMLASDSESEARRSSGLIARDNSIHFYDAEQATGWAYHRGPFAEMADRAKAALPEDHWLAERLAEHRDDSPQWDLYMLYAPGVLWARADAGPPAPTAWIRHIGRPDGEVSVYWRDTPDEPPREGDLFEAMRAMALETMGAPMKPPRIELLGFPGCPNTPKMRESLAAALSALGDGWGFVDVDQEQLDEHDLRRGYPTPTILVDGRDLYGMPTPTGPAMGCRVYPDGVPDARDVERSLRAILRE